MRKTTELETTRLMGPFGDGAKDDCEARTCNRVRSRNSRDELVAEYERLAKDALPARAKEKKWPIRFDHCFMRVMLDCAFGKCWYECLDRKRGSAISQISDADLAAAVAVGKRMEAEGRSAVDELDARSLRLRGKRPKTARRS